MPNLRPSTQAGSVARFLGLIVAAWLAAAGSAAAEDAGVVLQCARVIDVERREVLEPAAVLVRGNRIEAVGTDLAESEGAARVDLGDRTCAPGFMDTHVHLGPRRRGDRERRDLQPFRVLARPALPRERAGHAAPGIHHGS